MATSPNKATEQANDPSSGIHDSLVALRLKCSDGSDLFHRDRFRNVPPDIAWARAACWSVVHDVFAISMLLTDGQKSTIVDASSSIIPRAQMDALKRAKSLKDVSRVINKHGHSWAPGIMAARSLWSGFHDSAGAFPKNLFLNSEATPFGRLLLAASSAMLNSGGFERGDWSRRFASSIDWAARKADDFANGRTPADEKDLMDGLLNGNLTACNDGGDLPPPSTASSPDTLLKQYGINLALIASAGKAGDGGFGHFRTPADLIGYYVGIASDRAASIMKRTVPLIGPAGPPGNRTLLSDDADLPVMSVEDRMRKSPGFHAILNDPTVARMLSSTKAMHSDLDSLASCILRGAIDHNDRYSPIVLPGVSAENHSRLDAIRTLSLQEQSELGLKGGAGISMIPFDCSRFAGTNAYSKKYALEACEVMGSLVAPPTDPLYRAARAAAEQTADGSSDTAEAILLSASKVIVSDPDLPDTYSALREYAFCMARSEDFGNDSMTKVEHAAMIVERVIARDDATLPDDVRESAKEARFMAEYALNGGRVASMDKPIGDSTSDLGASIGGKLQVIASQTPDAFEDGEMAVRDTGPDADASADGVPLSGLATGSGQGTRSFFGQLADKYDDAVDILTKINPDLARRMALVPDGVLPTAGQKTPPISLAIRLLEAQGSEGRAAAGIVSRCMKALHGGFAGGVIKNARESAAAFDGSPGEKMAEMMRAAALGTARVSGPDTGELSLG